MFPGQLQWLALILLCLAIGAAGMAFLRRNGDFAYLRQAIVAISLMVAAGCLTVWAKSEMVGKAPIAGPIVTTMTATVLDREEQPADRRVRLIVAAREPDSGRPIRLRVNLPMDLDRDSITPGAQIRVRLRLMPPAPPMLPGGYNFARTAWFSGLSATGSVLGPVEVLLGGDSRGSLSRVQSRLSQHVRERLDGPAGSIAATLASGDRGAIHEDDAQAMRDAGLAHLLSISGLHVSAVVAAAYLISIRLLALWSWLALRVRLPLVAAGAGALAGIGYTLLTGAQVPTVRSCVGAVLVLAALALGREALSLRVLAVAAMFVMLLWPEAIVGPSFQMSFAAVLAIIGLNSSQTVRGFLSRREEGWSIRALRYIAMLFATGLLIELALMPIALFHFHRAGIYGAFANVIAIPLTTLVSMPLIGIALLLDIAGAGGPAWWLAGKSIEAMLTLAHWISAQPGAVSVLPAMGIGSFALFLAGSLWLALWHRRVRFLGLLPIALGAVSLATLRPPDILVSGDGRHVGITGESDSELLVIRASRSSYVQDNLTELAGMKGNVRLLADWPEARCSADFCTLALERGGRSWRLLIARSKERISERALAAACDRADIVIADRWLPRSCRPAVLKADRRMLSRTGGLAINLDAGRIRTVAEGQGDHGWWRPDRQ